MHAGSRWSKDFLVLDLLKIRTGKPIHVYRTTRVVVPHNHTFPLKEMPVETQPSNSDSEAGGADPEPLSEEQLPDESAILTDQPPPAVVRPNAEESQKDPEPRATLTSQPGLDPPPVVETPVEAPQTRDNLAPYKPGEDVEERLLTTRRIQIGRAHV